MTYKPIPCGINLKLIFSHTKSTFVYYSLAFMCIDIGFTTERFNLKYWLFAKHLDVILDVKVENCVKSETKSTVYRFGGYPKDDAVGDTPCFPMYVCTQSSNALYSFCPDRCLFCHYPLKSIKNHLDAVNILATSARQNRQF